MSTASSALPYFDNSLANSEDDGIIGSGLQDPQEEFLRIPELAASRVSEKINSGEFSTKLSRQQYERHVRGTEAFDRHAKDRLSRGLPEQSELFLTAAEAQQLILDKAGTGIIKVSKKGEMLPRESITADRIVGITYSGNDLMETNKVRIHYGKRSSHIVPIGGMDYD